MLTYDDCLAFSGLAPEEIVAIAWHEHLPEIMALEKGWRLCQTPEGRQLIQRMLLAHSEAKFRQAAGLIHSINDTRPGRSQISRQSPPQS